MPFPKKGKFFPKENGYAEDGQHLADNWFAAEIASTLKRSLGNSRAGVKVVASWTSANEKTVKNRFAGRYGPSGEHLVALARHSDEVLGCSSQ
ncbi:MAG: XRE family transcriptional regulator [Paracoccus sp. (in: a-proteobacteria)]|nr:XRE family transcriptional regulator [Paracoccus sp. (in: a-proteobacteria)]